MQNKFIYTPSLLPITIKMLSDRATKNISLAQIAHATNLHPRHIVNIQSGGVPNPTVKTIEALYQYLVFRGMNPKNFK